MIRGLLVGGTYGDDENAILTVLGASLDAGDLVVVIDAADAWDLAYAFNGEEYTKLREQYFVRHYYARTVQQTAERLIRKCLDGETGRLGGADGGRDPRAARRRRRAGPLARRHLPHRARTRTCPA